MELFFQFQGKEIEEGSAEGALCLSQSWPGMARTIHGDHNRFMDTYLRPYPGMFVEQYCHGYSLLFICTQEACYIFALINM